jgi:hypothetical protein
MRADADFYLARLYPMQDRVLARLAPDDLKTLGERLLLLP